jgi:hypothetical protein
MMKTRIFSKNKELYDPIGLDNDHFSVLGMACALATSSQPRAEKQELTTVQFRGIYFRARFLTGAERLAAEILMS